MRTPAATSVALLAALVVALVGALVPVRADGAGAAVARGAETRPTWPVGSTTRTFVDKSRRTPADASAGITPADRRVLPTTIYYPARRRTGADGTVTPGAEPARGRHPLVLFNPGSPGTPEDYEDLLADWAAHGYVVAAPRFPVSSVSGPDDVAWRDLPAQTKDARFVLDRVLRLDPERVGIPRIDDERIAVAGHSFGGATALSLASKCCRDDRVDAVVALAAVSETPHGPKLRRPAGPILFVHAAGDRAVQYAPAAARCEKAGKPKRILTVKGLRGLRAHVNPYLGTNDWSAVVRPAIVDFLDGYVRDDRAARRRLERAGDDPQVATLGRCRPGDAPLAPTTTTTSAARASRR